MCRPSWSVDFCTLHLRQRHMAAYLEARSTVPLFVSLVCYSNGGLETLFFTMSQWHAFSTAPPSHGSCVSQAVFFSLFGVRT